MILQGRDLSIGMRGEDVAHLHTALCQLGFILSDSEEKCRTFGRATQQAVMAFQTSRRLDSTGIVDTATARAMEATVDEAESFTVEGKVVSRLRAGVGKLLVVIIDKNAGEIGDVLLAKAVTDDSGEYRVTFGIGNARERGKRRPDLQARVLAGETFLGASAVRYNAANREKLDVLLTEKASTALASEHESLTGAIANHFRGTLRDIEENDERQDITYLANKTGWDARAVALAALADQFSARTGSAAGVGGIAPAFFYTLFRAGVPADEKAIYQITPETAVDIWKRAIARGVIPAKLEAGIPQAIEQFRRLAVERTLDGPALAGVSSLKDMLTVSLGNDPTRHKRFAELYAEHRNDPERLWETVRRAFGEAVEKRLRLDGQLGYLTLNNAALMGQIHTSLGQNGMTDLVQLADHGLYRADKWVPLIGEGAIPPEIPGENDTEKRARYAELLAAKVRLSFPTAVVAQMVKTGELPLTAASSVRDAVHGFLTEHQGKFEFGMQPVQRYIARNRLDVPQEISREISRIQRIYQITPSDEAMTALLESGIDSALAVSRYDREQFVGKFKEALGSEANARLTHAKAQQIHNVTLNLATSYLVARTAPQIGVHSPAKYANATPVPIHQAQQAVASNQATGIRRYLEQIWAAQSPENAEDVIPYATLEALFGEMDYCTCEHCRSVLSPAAYLVDLLQFLDRDDLGADQNPLNVLLGRRPDIEHLPLTCENTNTPLPYIDLVNETLEYYVTHNLSLAAYPGHSTDSAVTTEELLATPQFVEDAAYTTLAATHFPLPLPFHQPLENLRRYFDKFETPLSEVMEVLRTNDETERPAPADPANPIEYGWRDILMEELRLSRAEYQLLTDRNPTLAELYGYGDGAADGMIRDRLTNAKVFTRRVGISYEEIVEIQKTRFVNPNLTMVPKLERLGLPFGTLKAFKDGTVSEAEFDALLPSGLDPGQYGGDIKAWVKNDENYAKLMGLITLTDPTGENDPCSFDKVEFRYSNPDKDANTLRPFEFVRLIRFIRLWKKLGWTIEQTDKVITALYPQSQTPDSADDAVNLQRLDQGFSSLLPRLGVLKRLMKILKLKPKKDLLPLLACFAPIDTHGAASLYRQMFLYPAPEEPKEKNPFADDGYGNFLDGSKKLLDHKEALRAAFLLTDEELSLVVSGLPDDANAIDRDQDGNLVLTVRNISAIFRRGWLARKLKLSVREFLLLTEMAGVDPFAPPDPPQPPILRFVDLVSRLRAAALKPEQALYLVWNQDISGRSAPAADEVLEFARALRAAFGAIESEFALADDPTGQIARARMALVYGNDATNFFFGLLDNTLAIEVSYDHHQASLEQSILEAASGRIAYDDFGKRLSFAGVMTEAVRDALKIGVPLTFENAVDGLYEKNQKVIGPFFARYPELMSLYENYVASNSSAVEKKRSDLLASFLPELKHRRKRQQALAAVSAAAKADIAFASALLDDKSVLNPAVAAVFPALADASALDDLTATETAGLSAWFYAGVTVGGPGVPPDHASDAEAILAYSADSGTTLPFSPASGIWSGFLEAPENGLYNFSVEPGAAGGVGAATATLTLGGENRPLEKNGEVWSNTTAIELRAGTLYPVTLVAENITAGLKVRWQTQGRGWEVIPPRYLYPETPTDHLRTTYVRFLKAVSLASRLKLTPSELAHFGAKEDYRIGGRGWLNRLPVVGSPDGATSPALLRALEALLDFAGLKAKFAPNDERLLAVLKDPHATVETADGTLEKDKQSLLLALTRWDRASLDTLLLRFGKHLPAQPDQADRAALKDIDTWVRVHRAFAPVKKIGVSASALIAAATNEPQALAVRVFKAALRARYEESDWLNVLRPINDEMRGLQRDALVAYILHQMRAHSESEHIDTPEKLFEYFLMDVQMAPCMQTSRIRHALSSVQLFIERCFMNLETGVPPSVFKPKHRKRWEWMKRYRVWEANRKVFLWPENWAEPELRIDQSPFFKEAMSELLQSDITEDRAATALLNYLAKLEEVAKLEPCGIHFVEGDAGTADDIAHVVARTAGANRKYFYRRQESGLWTPWEQIKLDIEDNPVLPVVWKDRLFLFWLKILMQGPSEAQKPGQAGDKLTDLTTDAIQTKTNVTVQALLCWSEYYNGKWQATKTSDVTRPAMLGVFSALGPNSFDRSKLRLSVFYETDALRVRVVGEGSSWFLLYNTHSLPLRPGDGPIDWEVTLAPFHGHQARRLEVFGSESDRFRIGYFRRWHPHAPPDFIRSILIRKKPGKDRVIDPHHYLEKPWEAPFFYEDSRHVFYVTTEERLVRIPQWVDFGLTTNPPQLQLDIPQLVLKPVETIPDLVGPVVMQPDFSAGDPASMERFVTEDAFIHRGIGTLGTVSFGDKEIGPSGSQIQVIGK
jgi:hypothetical protein